jgi:DNA-binding FrmR family transcriptional regulator
MDKKTKKKLQNLNQRLQKLQQQLAGVKQQADDPGELEALKAQITDVEAQIAKARALSS